MMMSCAENHENGSNESKHSYRNFFQENRRWILYGYSFITVVLASATVYGWPALRRELREEGSTLNEDHFGAIFTVGAWSTQGLRFFTGLLRDRFGTRKIAISAILCSAAGFATMAWCSPNSLIGLAIAMLLIGTGSGAQLCIQPMAGLFPKRSGSVLASFSGAAQLSGLIFLMLTSMGDRRTTFSVFSGILVFMAAVALKLLPTGGSFTVDENGEEELCYCENEKEVVNLDVQSDVENPSPEAANESNNQHHAGVSSPPVAAASTGSTGSSDGSPEDTTVESAKELDDKREPSLKTDEPLTSPTAREQLFSLEYILVLSWFSLSVAPLFYYVGSIGFQLEEMGDDDGFYTNIFTIVFSMAAIFSPLGGWMSDTYGLAIAEAMGAFMTAVAFFFLSAERLSLNAHIVGLSLYGVGRMCVFGTFFSHIGKRFGYQNYGTLAGLGLISSALLSLLQYPMIAAAADGYSREMNLLSGCIFVMMLPYFVWLYRREQHETRTAKGQ